MRLTTTSGGIKTDWLRGRVCGCEERLREQMLHPSLWFQTSGRDDWWGLSSRTVMMHGKWGGWDIGAALFNLHPQAAPWQGTLPEEEVWQPGAKLRRRRLNTAYKWREMTVKWVMVQMAEDASINGNDSRECWECRLLVRYVKTTPLWCKVLNLHSVKNNSDPKENKRQEWE